MLTIVPGLFFPAPSQSCQFGCYEVRKSAFGLPANFRPDTYRKS